MQRSGFHPLPCNTRKENTIPLVSAFAPVQFSQWWLCEAEPFHPEPIASLSYQPASRPFPLQCKGVKFDFRNVFSGSKLESWCLPGRKLNPQVKIRAPLGEKRRCVCVMPDTLRVLATWLCQKHLVIDQTELRALQTFLLHPPLQTPSIIFHEPWTVLCLG
jgi:hypothetical protein